MLKEKLHMNFFTPKKLFLFVVALLFGVLFSLSSITSVQAKNDKTKKIRYDTNGYIEGDIIYTDKEDEGGGEENIVIEASFDFAHTDDSFESLNLRVSEDLPSYQEEGYVVGNNEGDESQFLFAALQLECVDIAEDGQSAFIAGQAFDMEDRNPTGQDGKWLLIQLIDDGIDGDGIYWSTPKWSESENVIQTCQNGTANPLTEGWSYYEAFAYTEDGQTRVDAIDIYPENSGDGGGEETNFEYYQHIIVNGENKNGGTLHWENPYDDWGNVNPEEVGLPATTTPEEMEAYGAELWYDMELSCVNVIGGQQGAFAAGQIVDAGQIVTEAGRLETWHVFQFLDNGTGPDDMFYSYETQEMDLTEEQATSYCLSGSLNVEDEWQLGAPNTILEGDISITTPTLVDRVYQIGEELALVADRGELDIGCTDAVYTLVDGEFSKYYKETYTPNREAFESGEPGAKMRISITNQYSGDWAYGTWGEPEEGSPLFDLANSTALTAEIVIGTDGSEKVDFSWSGEFVNQDTDETEDWFNGDFKIKNGELQNGTVEGTCSLM